MKTTINDKTVRLPDFLVVGTARSGTTSIYNYLNEHPGVFIPDIKESYFFAYPGDSEGFAMHDRPRVWRVEDYAKLFEPAREDQILGEVSASYLYLHEKTIPNIMKYVPDWRNLKIIIVLREPVDRALSMYSYFLTWEEEPLNFEEALNKITERLKNKWHPEYDYVGYGLYYEQVKAYMNTFADIRVYLYEDLRADTAGLMRDIFRFIGVDDSFVPSVNEKHNPSRVSKSLHIKRAIEKPNLVSSIFPLVKLIPLEKRVAAVKKLESLNIKKHARMKKKTKNYLKQLYRDDILKLQELIGKDLSEWLD